HHVERISRTGAASGAVWKAKVWRRCPVRSTGGKVDRLITCCSRSFGCSLCFCSSSGCSFSFSLCLRCFLRRLFGGIGVCLRLSITSRLRLNFSLLRRLFCLRSYYTALFVSD